MEEAGEAILVDGLNKKGWGENTDETFSCAPDTSDLDESKELEPQLGIVLEVVRNHL